LYTTNDDGLAFRYDRFDSERGAEWYLLRNARVNGIDIRIDLIKDSALRERLLASQGRHMQWVHIEELREPVSESVVLDVARWCPGVRDVYLRNRKPTPPWDHCLLTLIQACSQLSTLYLRRIKISASGLVEALEACKNVRNLTIVEFEGGMPLEVALPTLQNLTLKACGATDETMTAVASNCPLLQTLKVFDGNDSTDAGVRAVLQGCPLLRETDVEYANDVSAKLRVELAKRAQFKSINLMGWYDVSDEMAQGVLKVSPGLTSLTLSADCQTDATLAVCAQHCPLIEELCFEGGGDTPTSAGVLQVFKPGSTLRCVHFEGCPQLGDEVVLVIAQSCPLLRVVGFLKFALTDHAVAKLAESCPGLQEVDLRDTAVGDEGLTSLATHCSGLQSVNLQRCPNISLHGVRALAERCSNLTSLYLPKQFSDQPLPKLKAPGARVLVVRTG
jgi:hypothetical protein